MEEHAQEESDTDVPGMPKWIPGGIENLLMKKAGLSEVQRASKSIRALDALNAADMKYKGYAITTPNSDWIPQYPLVNGDGITKHDDGQWGGHEYSRWPQIFSRRFIHHSCIPFDKRNCRGAVEFRNCADASAIHFYDPKEDTDFVRDRSLHDTVVCDTDSGTMRHALVDALDIGFTLIAAKVESVGKERSNEEGPGARSKNIYHHCARSMTSCLERLRSLKSSWRVALSSFREAQRVILELHGLHVFLRDVLPRLEVDREFSFSVLPVRGAFSTDVEVVRNLYRLGVPVWFVCDAQSFTGRVFAVQKCVHWSRYLSPKLMEYAGRKILDGPSLHSNARLHGICASHFMTDNYINDLLDEIYTFERFSADSSALRRVHPPTPELPQSTSPQGSSCFRNHTPPMPKRSTFPQTEEKLGRQSADSASIAMPRPRVRRSRHAKPVTEPYINHSHVLYIPCGIDGTPDLPPLHSVVLDCLREVSPVKDDKTTPALYPLPPPFLLVNPDANKCADLYLNYIRIRPSLIDMLIQGDTFDHSIWRKMRDWRVILHGDYSKSTPLPPNATSPFVKRIYDLMPTSSSSREREHRFEMNELPLSKRRRIADNAMVKVILGVEREFESFDRTKAQLWRGNFVSSDDIKHDKVLRMEVQWELSELLFRYEFYALDHAILPRQCMTKEEARRRNELIGRIFSRDPAESLLESVVPDISKPVQDYWDKDMDEDYLQVFWRIFADWPEFPAHSRVPDFKTSVEFYVKTFTRYFKRMPSMHYSIPSSLALYPQ